MVSACGFDSVPAEIGYMFNSRQWVPPSVPNAMEAYLSLESEKRIVGNFATYESAVLGVANAEVLRQLRRSWPRKARPQVILLAFSCDLNSWLRSKNFGLFSVSHCVIVD